MRGRVIQGFFVGGQMRAAAGVLRPAAGSLQRAAMPGPPPRAPAMPVAAAQARMAPGRPALAHQPARVAQPYGGSDSFDVDPVRLGLARGGGSSLPEALRAKMEAAFGADFSAVRIHVGPQASRIGAVAFTTGNDLYFAPGQFQPESVKGQQLIGHELAHVIQQRQGRVRAAGSGVAVVQDHALEAEADRLGMRAANFRAHVRREPATGVRTDWAANRSLQRSRPSRAPAKPKLTAGYTKKTKGYCGFLNCERQWGVTQIGLAPSGGLIIQKVTRSLNVALVTSSTDMSESQLDTYVSGNAASTANAKENLYWEVFTVDSSSAVKPAVDSFGFCAMTDDGAVLDKTKGTITITGTAAFYQCSDSVASTIKSTYFTDTVKCANGLPSSTTDNIAAIIGLVGAANISADITGTVTISWNSTHQSSAPAKATDDGTYTFA